MRKIFLAALMISTAPLLEGKEAAEHTKSNAYNELTCKNSHSLIPLDEYKYFLHNIIDEKIALLNIYGNYRQLRNKALFRVAQLVKENNESWKVSDARYIEIINLADFPEEKTSMESELRMMEHSLHVGYKAKYCLELIDEGNSSDLSMLFDLLFKEISNDLSLYEKLDIDLSRFKIDLEVYNQRIHFMVVE